MVKNADTPVTHQAPDFGIIRRMANLDSIARLAELDGVLRLAPELPEGVEAVSLDTLLEEGKALLAETGAAALPEKTDPDALAVIIYTSGTTGANKGVMLSNRNIMGTLRGCARLLHYPRTSISVLPTPNI